MNRKLTVKYLSVKDFVRSASRGQEGVREPRRRWLARRAPSDREGAEQPECRSTLPLPWMVGAVIDQRSSVVRCWAHTSHCH